MAEHRPKMVFLTSPNNPDGSMLSTEELLEILKLPTLVRALGGCAFMLHCMLGTCGIRRTSSLARSDPSSLSACPRLMCPDPHLLHSGGAGRGVH